MTASQSKNPRRVLYVRGLSLAILIFLAVIPCYAQTVHDGADPAIRKLVVDYIEKRKRVAPNEKAFLWFDFFGTSREGNKITVFGWCGEQTFVLADNQVLEGGGSWGPAVVFLEEGKTGIRATGYKEPREGRYTEDTRKLIPKRYWKIVFEGSEKRWMPLVKKFRARVIAYYSSKLNDDRFIDIPGPTDFKDPHNHIEEIYKYLNLRDTYRQVSIQPDSYPSKVVTTGGGKPIYSPDNRFMVWSGFDQHRHYYFQDVHTKQIYEIVNRTKNWQINLAWKGDHILVFDQWNGVNRFRETKDEEKNWGVHIELDLQKREIIWAVPFGVLGFPKKK